MDTSIRTLKFEAMATSRDAPAKCHHCVFYDAHNENCDSGLFETKGIAQYSCIRPNVYWKVVKHDATED